MSTMENHMNKNSGSNQSMNAGIPKSKNDSVKIVGVTISFMVLVFFLVQFLILSITGISGYSGIKSQAQQLEQEFQDSGKSLVLALASAATLSYGKKNGNEELTHFYYEIAGNKVGSSKAGPISAVFLLHKDGKVLAHSDFVEVSAKNKTITEVSSRYNTRFFHEGILLNKGQVSIRNLPYPIAKEKKQNNLNLISSDYEYSTDFSTPIEYKGKKKGTVHIIKNRIYMHKFMNQAFQKYLVQMLIAFIGGLFISVIILFVFSLRWNHAAKLWEKFLRYRFENELIKTQMESSLNEMKGKVNQLTHERSVSTGPKALNTNPIDAILIE